MNRQRPHINHFDKVKGKNRVPPSIRRAKIYMDSETYTYYDSPDAEPVVIPYLIGVTDEITRKFSYFLGSGVDATVEFFKYLLGDKSYQNPATAKKTLNDVLWQRWKKVDGQWLPDRKIPLNRYAELICFNIGYDYHALRPWIEGFYGHHVNIYYQMTSKRKFISGYFKSPPKKYQDNNYPFKGSFDITLRDLWMWNKHYGLAGRINNCREIIWNPDKTVKDNSFAQALLAELGKWGLNWDNFKKGDLGEDYEKVNLHERDGKYYYWPSKESWLAKEPPKLLDLEKEIEYLKMDVMTMPIVLAEEEKTREILLNILQIKTPEKRPIDFDHSITAPGFSKYLFEEYCGHYMQQLFRVRVCKEEYELMEQSFSGAFTASNPNILYLDAEKFKEMYPGKEFYDEKSNPRIRSYDINSEYPYVMSQGVPYGPVMLRPPKDPYITWYEVNFYDYIDPENKIVYRWKKEYQCFNNSFFGDTFLVSAGIMVFRTFVLKELYELFESMCEGHFRVTGVRYQRRDTEYYPSFIDTLYKIKQNKENKYTKAQVSCVKLMLNSQYGKTAEKFRKTKLVYTNNKYEVIKRHKFKASLMGIMDTSISKEIYNEQNTGPYEHGWLELLNLDKRFYTDQSDCRESIMTGLYITQKSRWLLISTIKGEIDQGNVFLNCDTDSIKLLEFYPPKFKIDSGELGAWKHEGNHTHFGHANKHKKYFLLNTDKEPFKGNSVKIALGGIPHSKVIHEGMSWDEIKQLLKTIFDLNNRVVVCKAKKTCTWTKTLHQPIIKNVDIEVLGCQKFDITHKIENKKLIPCLTQN